MASFTRGSERCRKCRVLCGPEVKEDDFAYLSQKLRTAGEATGKKLLGRPEIPNHWRNAPDCHSLRVF